MKHKAEKQKTPRDFKRGVFYVKIYLSDILELILIYEKDKKALFFLAGSTGDSHSGRSYFCRKKREQK